MDLKVEELAERYEKLSTNELLKRYESGNLLPLAQQVARDELLARGVSLGESEGSESSDPTESSTESDIVHDFVTIARIVNPLRANLLKVHLEGEGIVTHLLGGHLGVVDIYLSAGSGGVHVQVRKDQAAHALEVLSKFDEIEKEIYESRNQKSTTDPGSNKRKESLNKPASPLFFWFFAMFAFVAIAFALFG